MSLSGTENITGLLSANGGINTTTVVASAGINTTTVVASGDLKYNGSTSLTTQIATLNGYKTSGTFAATTAWQTFFTFPSGTRGFVTVIGAAGNLGMMMGLFEGTSGQTYGSLTQLAASGNNNQAVLNTTNASTGGTQVVFIQNVISSFQIQVRVATACTVSWYITYV